jgi:hypothetical protein
MTESMTLKGLSRYYEVVASLIVDTRLIGVFPLSLSLLL